MEYKDINALSAKPSISGTEKIVVSSTEFITTDQIVSEAKKYTDTEITSAKKYTDDLIGDINSVLDTINGEVV